MARRPWFARRSAPSTREASKTCPSSIPPTSVSSDTPSRSSCAVPTAWEGIFMSEWLTISSAEKRASIRGLKICTFWRAIWARRTRRISSSLLPLNMLPTTTSIQPVEARPGFGGVTRALLDPLDVRPALGVDLDPVPLGDEGRHVDDEAGLHLGGLAHVRDRGALDRGLRLHHLHVHRARQLDSHGAPLVHLDLQLEAREQVVDRVAPHLGREAHLLVGLVVHDVVHVAFGG